MKLIAVILVSYLTLLTVEPVAYQVYTLSKHHSCCGARCCSTGKQCSDNQPATCNSCAGCTLCLAGYIQQDTYKIQPLAAERVFGPGFNKGHVSNYSSTFFRPPQVV